MNDIGVYDTTISGPRLVAPAHPEIVVPTFGSIVLSLDAPVRAGVREIVLTPPHPGRRLNAGGGFARAVHFEIRGTLAARLSAFLPSAAAVFETAPFGDAVPTLLRERSALDASSLLALEGAICTILALSRRFLTAPRRRTRSGEVAAAIEYASAHLSEAITLDQLASASGMSSRGIAGRFAAELSTSPLAYVRQLRLAEAERLLRETGLSIGDIAERCGFYDHAHLSRMFRERLRISPAQYRHQSRRQAVK